MRRLSGTIFAVVLASLAVVVGAAGAAEPTGARFAYVEVGEGPSRFEVRSRGLTGAVPVTIAGGPVARSGPFPFFLQPPSWSGDGTMLTFAGIDYGKSSGLISIFVVGADGRRLRKVPGTREGSGAVFSPDGRAIAFARTKTRTRKVRGEEEVVFQSTAVWLADLTTGKVRRLTPLRDGFEMEPSSFSPDGTSLATVRGRTPRAKPEIVLLSLAGEPPRVLASGATDAVFSPDGARIAYLRLFTHRARAGGAEPSTDLFVMNADGSGSRRLTSSRRGVEFWPSWDPSGQRIAFTRFVSFANEESALGFGDAIVQVNADGTCQSKLLVGDLGTAYYGGAWQPGPGREAGRIEC